MSIMTVVLAVAGLSFSESLPQKYTLDYPAAEKFCPPVRTTFYEVTRAVEQVNGRRFRHPLNGGFGFRMPQKIDGKPMIHLGADLGWFRVGEPVYAIANGVVRLSTGPVPPADDEADTPAPA
ncbi:MAG: hypothetical protein KY476_18485, partial [Planctomycetes bacterium]|nr:hypothetical protein [Planctomycetota bacterium]